jgi:hypothetical protein
MSRIFHNAIEALRNIGGHGPISPSTIVGKAPLLDVHLVDNLANSSFVQRANLL